MNYFTMIGLLAVIGLSSCKDEPVVVSSAVTVATKDSAIISGIVTAELNLQSAGAEAVPAGTSLLVSLPYSQLNATATGNWLKSVTVGTDGKYSVKVPTNSKGVSVTITPSNFEYNQIQTYVSGTTVPNQKLIYSTGSKSIDVVSGQSLSSDFFYATTTGNAIGAPKVTVSGKVQADLDASIIGLENLPDGTEIIFTANGWADSTSITAGKYSISVPKGFAVRWSVNKFINTKVWNPNNSNPSLSTYINIETNYSLSGTNSFNANMSGVDITPIGSSVSGDAPLTSIVSGQVTAELDLANAGFENMPNGTQIYFYTSNWGATATVSNGSYSINVPAGTIVNYYVKKTTNQNSASNVVSSHTFEVYGSFLSETTNTRYLNITAPDLFLTTTLTGTAKADWDLSIAGLENLPNGTKINFSTLTWNEDAIVTNGSYSINVPVNSNVYYLISKSINQKSASNVTTIHTFQVSGSFFSNSSGSLPLNLIATAI